MCSSESWEWRAQTVRAIRRPEEPPWGCRLKEVSPGTSLAVQGLGLRVCTTGGSRSTSALGTKMLHAVGAVKKKIKRACSPPSVFLCLILGPWTTSASASVSQSTIYSATSIRFAATSELLESKMVGSVQTPRWLTLESLACRGQEGWGLYSGSWASLHSWGPNAGRLRATGKALLGLVVGGGQAGSAWAAGLWEAARLSLGERLLLLAVHLLFPPGCGGEAGNSKGGRAGVRLVSKRG